MKPYCIILKRELLLYFLTTKFNVELLTAMTELLFQNFVSFYWRMALRSVFTRCLLQTVKYGTKVEATTSFTLYSYPYNLNPPNQRYTSIKAGVNLEFAYDDYKFWNQIHFKFGIHSLSVNQPVWLSVNFISQNQGESAKL